MWEATEELLFYCLAHPRSPSAVRRHQLSIRDGLWVALLGPSVEKGIVVIGPSVESALRVFDTQYLRLSEGVDGSNENSQLD
jgi:hypothetical protein